MPHYRTRTAKFVQRSARNRVRLICAVDPDIAAILIKNKLSGGRPRSRAEAELDQALLEIHDPEVRRLLHLQSIH